MKKQNHLLIILFIVMFLKSETCFAQWPVLVNDFDTTLINTPVIVDVKVNDNVGPTCIYILDFSICCGSFFGPQHGNITVLNWSHVKYTPNPGFTGHDSFLYSAYSDTIPTGSCDTARVHITVLNTTGVQNHFERNISFTLYPNPTAENTIYLKDIYFKKEEIEVKIYNLLGETVLDLKAPDIENGIVKIDISRCNSGIYVVEVKSEINRSVQKLVIE